MPPIEVRTTDASVVAEPSLASAAVRPTLSLSWVTSAVDVVIVCLTRPTMTRERTRRPRLSATPTRR